MNSTSSESSIEIDNVTYQLESIDEFGFLVRVDLPTGVRSKGFLTLGEEKLEIAFRVRENKEGRAKCSFSNLSIAGSESIQKYMRKRQRGFLEGALESRSYDDLAKGITGPAAAFVPQTNIPENLQAPAASDATSHLTAHSKATKSKVASSQWDTVEPHSNGNDRHTPKSRTATQPATSPQIEAHPPAVSQTAVSANVPSSESTAVSSEPEAARSGVRSLAMLLMMLAMIGLAILALYFLRSRSTLSIGNSALVGNYLPVNVKAEGEIIELLVAEGDVVKEGDVLVRLKNPTMQIDKDQCEAKLATADAKVKALRKQLKTTDKKLAIASKKLALDLSVAKSMSESAARFLEVAQLNFNRLEAAHNSGAITEVEFEVVRQELMVAQANKMTTENEVKQIEFSQASIKDNVLILGDRFDDESGRLVAELEIAEAELKEMQAALNVANEQFEHLNVTAPRDGTVYVTYRQVGEFVKVADETVGISFEGKVWAAGQVTASQARRVRPGQPVTVSAPSLDKKFQGVVSAVGHRAMYSHGRYTADFRGETATDVPVKVTIQDLPDDVPSGIRLEMAINTGFGVEWMDNAMGYSLRSISDGKPIKDNQPKEKTADMKPETDSGLKGEVVRNVAATQ